MLKEDEKKLLMKKSIILATILFVVLCVIPAILTITLPVDFFESQEPQGGCQDEFCWDYFPPTSADTIRTTFVMLSLFFFGIGSVLLISVIISFLVSKFKNKRTDVYIITKRLLYGTILLFLTYFLTSLFNLNYDKLLVFNKTYNTPVETIY